MAWAKGWQKGGAQKGGWQNGGAQQKGGWVKVIQTQWVKQNSNKGSAKGSSKGGFSKGGGKGKGGQSMPTLPANFKVDTAKRYTGTVAAYFKYQGYGFITFDQQGVIPNCDRVFCHWKAISSSDRFPSLQKDTKVKFSLEKREHHGKHSVHAVNVTGMAGEPIAIQDESDEKKAFVGGQHLRYTGKLKFYIPKRGYGYIEIDDGYQYDKEGVPKDAAADIQKHIEETGAKFELK